MRITDTHVYFYSSDDYMSNFYPSEIMLNGTIYCCVEQILMSEKAKVFNDKGIYKEIMHTSNPTKIKTLGRKVKNFNNDIWLQHRDDILYNAIYAKFMQSSNLKKLLLNTKNKTLVEASPTDKIYGVGLRETDDRILNENNWQGTNLLGKTLMRVRLVINDNERI